MPELPEVETIARMLDRGNAENAALPGKVFAKADLLWNRTLAAVQSSARLIEQLPGQQVKSVGRRGKFILIRLTQHTLLVHLRMSGDLRVEAGLLTGGGELPVRPHDRALFYFTDGDRLVFNDTRKFGRIWFTADPQEIVGALGPEPLSDSFTAELFYEQLQRHQRQLKPLIMDQHFLAGMGNIYTDEALHLAKLNPLMRANQISREQAENLWVGIRSVLTEGIERNGASIDWVYRGGSFQNTFHVYQQTGQPCQNCGTPIQKIVVGQRGTHFCPVCQPLPAGTA